MLFLHLFLFTVSVLCATTAHAQKFMYDDTILSFYEKHISPEMKEDNVFKEIQKQLERHKDMSISDYQHLEKQWQIELEEESYIILPELLTRKSSLTASRIKENANGIISSVTFVDKNGLNVSQSNVSQNYWQATQPYWKALKERKQYISNVKYDPISTKFIVTAAFPVKNEHGLKSGYAIIDFDALELECIAEGVHPYNNTK